MPSASSRPSAGTQMSRIVSTVQWPSTSERRYAVRASSGSSRSPSSVRARHGTARKGTCARTSLVGPSTSVSLTPCWSGGVRALDGVTGGSVRRFGSSESSRASISRRRPPLLSLAGDLFRLHDTLAQEARPSASPVTTRALRPRIITRIQSAASVRKRARPSRSSFLDPRHVSHVRRTHVPDGSCTRCSPVDSPWSLAHAGQGTTATTGDVGASERNRSAEDTAPRSATRDEAALRDGSE